MRKYSDHKGGGNMIEFILSVLVPLYIGIGVPLTFALVIIGFRKTFNWVLKELKSSDFFQKILVILSLVLISPALIVTLILMLVVTIASIPWFLYSDE